MQYFQREELTCCCCLVASVVSDPVRPHGRQPTRLSRPWDSPGKNTGVGCHFLLQCMQVKSEREVTQSCPTLATPWTAAYQALPSMGFSRQKYWSGVPLPSPKAHLGIPISSPQKKLEDLAIGGPSKSPTQLGYLPPSSVFLLVDCPSRVLTFICLQGVYLKMQISSPPPPGRPGSRGLMCL